MHRHQHPDVVGAAIAMRQLSVITTRQLAVAGLGPRAVAGRLTAAPDEVEITDQRLIAAGYRVMRFTWRQLERKPLRVAASLAAALARGPVGAH